MEQKRLSNIDLLKVIAALEVVLLHYNNAEIGGGFKFVQIGTMNQYWIIISQAFCITAVSIFVMISGYFLYSASRISNSKITAIILQVSVLRIICYFFLCLVGTHNWAIKDFILAVLPTNYYIVLYIVLLIFSPYINKLIHCLSKKEYKKLIITLFVVYSVYAYAIECGQKILGEEIISMSPLGALGSQAGYNIINFLLLYLIGAYVHIYDVNYEKNKLFIILGVSIILLFGFSFMGNRAWNYNNPIVIVESVAIFMLFVNMKYRNTIISELSKASLCCYIIHGNFLRFFSIEFHVKNSVFIMIIHQIVTCIVLYILSYFVFKIYEFILKNVKFRLQKQ